MVRFQPVWQRIIGQIDIGMEQQEVTGHNKTDSHAQSSTSIINGLVNSRSTMRGNVLNVREGN